MQVNLHEDEVFVVFKALHWYKDRIINRAQEHRDYLEEDAVIMLQDKLTRTLKQELYVEHL